MTGKRAICLTAPTKPIVPAQRKWPTKCTILEFPTALQIFADIAGIFLQASYSVKTEKPPNLT